MRAVTLTTRVCEANIQTIEFDPSAPDLVGRYELNGPDRPHRSDYKRPETLHGAIIPNRAMSRSNADIETKNGIVGGDLKTICVRPKAQDSMPVWKPNAASVPA